MKKLLLILILVLLSGCKNLSKYDYACQKCGYGNVTDYKEEKMCGVE